MKNLFLIIAAALVLSSCSLTSNTIIKPYDSFILGNNIHGSFSVKLKNVSKNDVELVLKPISGGSHSPQSVKPNKSVKVKVDRNTALVIANKSADTASVDLYVVGDTGLSMGYQNKQ